MYQSWHLLCIIQGFLRFLRTNWSHRCRLLDHRCSHGGTLHSHLLDQLLNLVLQISSGQALFELSTEFKIYTIVDLLVLCLNKRNAMFDFFLIDTEVFHFGKFLLCQRLLGYNFALSVVLIQLLQFLLLSLLFDHLCN
jgi:hypothetical protein